jgi:hypothetical protein
MQRASIATDVTVVGGGLSGVCAAIAAARLGRRVALVQNRPVLGGNSSSEIRVWVCSATAHGTQRYARETGIMGELFVENQFVNQEGNPYLWDLVVLEAVRREPNIELFLNTDVHHLAMADAGTIASVTGWQMGSERELTFTSPVFLDCTGDGLVGYLAGAEYRVGREARAEYDESLAPDVADTNVLGSTILFYTKDAGRPVPFVAPSFAIDVARTSIPEKRIIRSGDNGCAYWWIEWGGELDTIHDNETIRNELWGVIYGIWDYIKNSGTFPDADTMTLEWVGSIPGKRESRRLMGDHVLTQHDVLDQVRFEDTVAFGGWSIDIHPPQGVYAYQTASSHTFADGVYEIPYRSLYSRNVDNLLFAGRNLSATHVAFASTRVMATCATLGEAAGTAAAMCVALGVTPRGLYEGHRHDLVQTLLRQDASVLGVANDDPADLARHATVSASSHLASVVVAPGGDAWPLTCDVGITLPVQRRLDTLSLRVATERDATLTVEVFDVTKPQNFVPNERLATVAVAVAAGAERWLDVPLRLELDAPSFVFVVVRAADGVVLGRSAEPLSGVLGYARQLAVTSGDANEGHNDQPLRQWNPKPFHRSPPCVRTAPAERSFAPENAVNGLLRPYGAPNLWLSERRDVDPEPWLALTWDAPQRIRRVAIVFNDDVHEDLINLHHHRTPFRVIPELVKDYALEARIAGTWRSVVAVADNRVRRRVHDVDLDGVTDLRLRVLATNGSAHAEVIEVRAYADRPS